MSQVGYIIISITTLICVSSAVFYSECFAYFIHRPPKTSLTTRPTTKPIPVHTPAQVSWIIIIITVLIKFSPIVSYSKRHVSFLHHKVYNISTNYGRKWSQYRSIRIRWVALSLSLLYRYTFLMQYLIQKAMHISFITQPTTFLPTTAGNKANYYSYASGELHYHYHYYMTPIESSHAISHPKSCASFIHHPPYDISTNYSQKWSIKVISPIICHSGQCTRCLLWDWGGTWSLLHHGALKTFIAFPLIHCV